MSKYIVEMPEGVNKDYWCGYCLDKCEGNPKVENCSGWILAKAQEVVEVAQLQKGDGLHNINGKPVKLYAAKVEDK